MHRPTTSQQQEERLEERAQGKEGEEEKPEEEKPEEEKLVTRTYKRRKVKLDPAELQTFIASTNNYIEDAKKFQEFYAEQELLASQHYQDARYKALAQLATDTTRRNNRVRELQEELQVTSKSGASASSSSSSSSWALPPGALVPGRVAVSQLPPASKAVQQSAAWQRQQPAAQPLPPGPCRPGSLGN